MSKKCEKKKHKTKGAARYAAKKMEIEFGVPYNHFRCNYCGQWHIGRSNKEQIKKIRKVYLEKNAAVIGIDPGKKGALALICGSHLEIHDYKDTVGAYNTVRVLNDKFKVKFAIIEKSWLRPKERDVKRAEVLIRNAEMWRVVLEINKIPYAQYSPITWRKNFIPKKLMDKDGYIKKAIELFPKHEDLFHRHDRAEAALIACRAWYHIESGMPVRKIGY